MKEKFTLEDIKGFLEHWLNYKWEGFACRDKKTKHIRNATIEDFGSDKYLDIYIKDEHGERKLISISATNVYFEVSAVFGVCTSSWIDYLKANRKQENEIENKGDL